VLTERSHAIGDRSAAFDFTPKARIRPDALLECGERLLETRTIPNRTVMA
jgi:hypothetical protein